MSSSSKTGSPAINSPAAPAASSHARLATSRGLLRHFMADAPFQPATNFWRAIELPVLAEALPKQGRGLDVGCGDGVLTRLLAELAGAQWSLVGIDPDPAECASAVAEGLFATVHNTGADRVPEPEASFDFAFANSVLEHIPDLPPCLAEVCRCLKPGGLFLATVPSPGLHQLMRGPSFLRRISRADYLAETDRRLLHFRYPSVDDWKRMLADAGFEFVSARGYLTGPQVRRWERWTNCTGGLLYRLKGAQARPIEIQRQFGMRRALPKPLRLLAGPLAWAAGRGVLDDDATDPNETACLLVIGRRP
ncbi:MAG: class I SAM-dependent methyltransferase [Planctomycetia bacterium]|nr:class I SAM-dependent methyltransferase [Planctomycetia bacterium]